MKKTRASSAAKKRQSSFLRTGTVESKPMPIEQSVHSNPSNKHTNGSDTREIVHTTNTTTTIVYARYPRDRNDDDDDDDNNKRSRLGYIADPTLLRRTVQQLYDRRHYQRRNHSTKIIHNNHPNDKAGGQIIPAVLYNSSTYWDVLFLFDTSSSSLITTNNIIPMNHSTTMAIFVSACYDPPGSGWEGGMGGYDILKHKLRIDHDDSRWLAATTMQPNRKKDQNNHKNAASSNSSLLCAMYTHSNRFWEARAMALTWGIQCDGFVAFSNQTIPNLGMIDLIHDGPESYGNMWQKTRAIWKYIHQHYAHQYEYFHLGGDDMFLIPNNLKHFLRTRIASWHNHNDTTMTNTSSSQSPFIAGQWIRQMNRPYIGGGPGYTMNRAALEEYMQVWDQCHATIVTSTEDRLLSSCLPNHVQFWDTRSLDSAEQLYHDVPPQQVYEGRAPLPSSNNTTSKRRANFHSRNIAYWESLPHPQDMIHNGSNAIPIPIWQPSTEQGNTNPVGPKHELAAAGTYSISFHYIRTVPFIGRIHAILYPEVCPPSSPLRQP